MLLTFRPRLPTLASPSMPSTRLWLVLALVTVFFLTLLSLPGRLNVPFVTPHSLFRTPAFLGNTSNGCPSVHIEPPPIDHGKQTCTSMPSVDSKFALELCHEPAKCNSFTLRVRRKHQQYCKSIESAERKVSPDPELDAWIRRNLGPDTFEIRTDGAERVAGQAAVYEGDCRWRFDVQLRNAGPVWLSAWHTYEWYQGFDEVNKTWPYALTNPLFSSPVALDICSPLCTPAPRPLQVASSSLLTYPPVKEDSFSSSLYDPSLPSCSETEPVSGSYFPLHPLDVLHPPAPLPQGEEVGQPTAGKYRFVPHGCRWKHPALRFGDPAACTKRPQRVLVWGDSHGRVAADSLYHRLSGQTTISTKSEKQGHKLHEAGNTTIEFIWDPKGTDQTCTPGGRPIAEYDAIVVSMMQHYNWDPTSIFLGNLTSLLDRFTACPGVPSRRVYLTSPAWPLRKDWWVYNFNDQRTNSRLRRWGALARSVAEERGWRVVDQFALSAPHIWELLYLDKAHLLGTDAIDPVVDEIVAKAGVCAVAPETREGHRKAGIHAV